MKAMIYRKYGSPDVLKFEEVPKPIPDDDEVLIRVRASSVNSWDWDLVRGRPYLARIGAFRKPRHRILGADVAGEVEAVGRDVTQLQPGDEAFGDISGCGWGGFAEYVCARADVLALKPASVTFEEAAALPQAGVLALQGLRASGPIQAGQSVLINGAGGGVGTFAIQMAKSFGAEVTGVDSTEKLDTMRSLGADHVIDYTQTDFTSGGRQYDFMLDVAAFRSVFDCARALSTNGTYVIVGGSTARIAQAMAMKPLISAFRSKKISLLLHKPNKTDLDSLKELLQAGDVVPVIDRQYALSEVPEALRYLGDGHARGKVVIRV